MAAEDINLGGVGWTSKSHRVLKRRISVSPFVRTLETSPFNNPGFSDLNNPI